LRMHHNTGHNPLLVGAKFVATVRVEFIRINCAISWLGHVPDVRYLAPPVWDEPHILLLPHPPHLPDLLLDAL